MNMIDVYVAKVGKHLPAKNRTDIEQEIRSLIEDAVDDAAEAQERERDEALIVDVLKKFGSPEQVAAAYGKPQYLIGPRVFPVFWTVLKIVLTVLLILMAIGIGLDLSQGLDAGQTIGEAILQYIANTFNTLIVTSGIVALFFALLERLLPEESWKTEEWDPRKMEAEPDHNRVNPAERIVELFFLVALLLMLNVYPNWIGIWGMAGGERVVAPVLAPAFFSYLPFINALLAVDLARGVLLLQKRSWTTGLRWSVVVTNLASIVLLGAMMFGPSLLQINASDLARLGWDAQAVSAFADAAPALATLFRLALGIALAMQLVEAGSQIYRIIGRPNFLPASR